MRLLSIPTWRDPLYGLRHDYYERTHPANHQHIMGYETACGIKLSVDDVNKKSLQYYEPNCLACIIAAPVFVLTVNWKVEV